MTSDLLRALLVILLLGGTLSATGLVSAAPPSPSGSSEFPNGGNGKTTASPKNNSSNQQQGTAKGPKSNTSGGDPFGGWLSGGVSASAGNGTNVSVGASAGGGGGGFLGGTGGILSVKGWMKQLKKLAFNTYKWALKQSFNLILGTTAPHNSGYLGIFGTPTGPYKHLYETYVKGTIVPFVMSCFVISLILSVIAIMCGGLKGRYRAGKFCFSLFGALVFTAFFWQYGTFVQAFSEALVHALAPTPDQLTNSMGSGFKSIAGPIAGVTALAVMSWGEAITLALIYGGRQALLRVAIYALPLIVAMMFLGPHRYIRKFGQVLWWQYHGLVVMTWPAAFVLGLAYHMKWSFTANGLGNFIATIGMFVCIILMPILIEGTCLIVPLFLRKQAGAVGNRVGSRLPGARDAHAWYRSRREGDEDDGESADRKDRSENNVDLPKESPKTVADGGVSTYNSGSSAADIRRDWAHAHGSYSEMRRSTTNVRQDTKARNDLLREQAKRQRDLRNRDIP